MEQNNLTEQELAVLEKMCPQLLDYPGYVKGREIQATKWCTIARRFLRLAEENNDLITLIRKWVKGFAEAEDRNGLFTISADLMKELQEQADEILTKIENRRKETP